MITAGYFLVNAAAFILCIVRSEVQSLADGISVRH